MLSLFTPTFGLCRDDASNNASGGLFIQVQNGVEAKLNVEGSVTLNSNGIGIFTNISPNSNVEINVETGATLETCGNSQYDIYGNVFSAATLTFSGDGYTCDNVSFPTNAGTIVEPVCQACPTA